MSEDFNVSVEQGKVPLARLRNIMPTRVPKAATVATEMAATPPAVEEPAALKRSNTKKKMSSETPVVPAEAPAAPSSKRTSTKKAAPNPMPNPMPNPEPAAPQPNPEPPAKASRKRKAIGEATNEPAAADTAKEKKKPKAPRAKSAFQFFQSEFRGTLEAGLALGEISKRCSAAWNGVQDKSKYEALANEDRSRVAEVRASTAPAKRPPTGYSRFLKAEHAKLMQAEPALDFGARAQRCRDAWKALTPEQKEGWKGEAAESTVSAA